MSVYWFFLFFLLDKLKTSIKKIDIQFQLLSTSKLWFLFIPAKLSFTIEHPKLR